MRKTIRHRVLPLAVTVCMGLSFAACQGSGVASASEQTAESGISVQEKKTESTAVSVEEKSAGQTAAEKENTSKTADTDYASLLFDTSYVHTIDISISEEDWQDLTENPLDKTKYKTDITIDGETVEKVSFATKGNTSLSSVASDPDSNRYSFKVNFGKYVDDQTYHGLNKLNLNNLYADATYMKDYLSYEIFRQAGVEAPLVSYVWLTVNGEDQGLYLAIEDISEGYLERTEDGEGVLYKPETEMLDNMDQAGNMPQAGGDFEMPEGMTPPDGNGNGGFPGGNGNGGFPGGNGDFEPPEGMTPPDGNGDFEMPEGMTPPDGNGNGGLPDGNGDGGFPGGMDFGFGSNGADLVYTDDNIGSYSDIFDNAETDADEEDMQRVISALKGLSNGENLEEVLDTEEIIRYFAAHNFVLNYDSYTGMMLHNYYLYEKDGKLSMLPWDYNLAFGGFGGGSGSDPEDATFLVNTGIDSPLSGTTEDARPMWSWIASDGGYQETYHKVYDELLNGYFESGVFEQEIDALYDMLLPYVEKDPSAFYTEDEFKTAYETLKHFCMLRAESIRAQLDGTLSTESSSQNAKDRIDASGINVQDMGSQGGGRMDQNKPESRSV